MIKLLLHFVLLSWLLDKGLYFFYINNVSSSFLGLFELFFLGEERDGNNSDTNKIPYSIIYRG